MIASSATAMTKACADAKAMLKVLKGQSASAARINKASNAAKTACAQKKLADDAAAKMKASMEAAANAEAISEDATAATRYKKACDAAKKRVVSLKSSGAPNEQVEEAQTDANEKCTKAVAAAAKLAKLKAGGAAPLPQHVASVHEQTEQMKNVCRKAKVARRAADAAKSEVKTLISAVATAAGKEAVKSDKAMQTLTPGHNKDTLYRMTNAIKKQTAAVAAKAATTADAKAAALAIECARWTANSTCNYHQYHIQTRHLSEESAFVFYSGIIHRDIKPENYLLHTKDPPHETLLKQVAEGRCRGPPFPVRIGAEAVKTGGTTSLQRTGLQNARGAAVPFLAVPPCQKWLIHSIYFEKCLIPSYPLRSVKSYAARHGRQVDFGLSKRVNEQNKNSMSRGCVVAHRFRLERREGTEQE